jgi:UDP-glucose 4-epimerase
LNDKQPTIYGDGHQSRDFTYVYNNVLANIQACFAENASGQVFNIACGESYSLLDLVDEINNILGKDIEPLFAKERVGDVKHSLADVAKAGRELGFSSQVSFADGLSKTVKLFS